jgi:hypothetical protein
MWSHQIITHISSCVAVADVVASDHLITHISSCIAVADVVDKVATNLRVETLLVFENSCPTLFYSI